MIKLILLFSIWFFYYSFRPTSIAISKSKPLNSFGQITSSPTPDFSPWIFFGSSGTLFSNLLPRHFLVDIREVTGLSPNLSLVQFIIVKPSAFTISFNASGTTNVDGYTDNNDDWTVSETSFFITVTLKPGVIINSNGFSRIGFTINRKNGVAANTIQNLSVTIINSSGGDNNAHNNTCYSLLTAL